MLSLDPSELPDAAKVALAELMLEEDENPADWELVYVWSNEKTPPGFSVVARRDDRQRAFTVMPKAGKYDVVEVTVV